ncbi:MAG: hypothetical protein COB04_02990 [Gammaproteobacteria bacterium]|nr:MAG: hypothetical protein COB04_02990 [Gammaproteobacteria bacterium]
MLNMITFRVQMAFWWLFLWGLVATTLVPLTAVASSLENSNFSPRYQMWLQAIKDDGWVKGDKNYYSELGRRILQKNRKKRSQSGTDLFALKRYCEWLPQCTPRSVYVIRFHGRGGCFRKEGDEAKDQVLAQYIQSSRKGVYLEGFWDFFFAERYHFGPKCVTNPSERYPRNETQWRHGVGVMAEYLSMVPVGSKIILAGFGLGATSALMVTRQLMEKHKRSVDYLILYDPVGPGGTRKNVQEIWAALEPGPVKVRNLYHRWQTNACLPYDYDQSGLLNTAGIAVANQKKVDFKVPMTEGDCPFLWRTTATHLDMSKGLEFVNDLGIREIIKRASQGKTVLCPKEEGCA